MASEGVHGTPTATKSKSPTGVPGKTGVKLPNMPSRPPLIPTVNKIEFELPPFVPFPTARPHNPSMARRRSAGSASSASSALFPAGSNTSMIPSP